MAWRVIKGNSRQFEADRRWLGEGETGALDAADGAQRVYELLGAPTGLGAQRT